MLEENYNRFLNNKCNAIFNKAPIRIVMVLECYFYLKKDKTKIIIVCPLMLSLFGKDKNKINFGGLCSSARNLCGLGSVILCILLFFLGF